jgi:hypothetical protein
MLKPGQQDIITSPDMQVIVIIEMGFWKGRAFPEYPSMWLGWCLDEHSRPEQLCWNVGNIPGGSWCRCGTGPDGWPVTRAARHGPAGGMKRRERIVSLPIDFY